MSEAWQLAASPAEALASAPQTLPCDSSLVNALIAAAGTRKAAMMEEAAALQKVRAHHALCRLMLLRRLVHERHVHDAGSVGDVALHSEGLSVNEWLSLSPA